MKNVVAILSLLAAIIALGCNHHEEKKMTGRKSDPIAKQETKSHGMTSNQDHGHGDHKHHHSFANPAELAKKWNDPERDKWQHPEEIIAALDLKPGATVADIGAGTGYMVAHLSKAVGPNGIIIAIDASAEMVEFLAKADLGPAKTVSRKVGLYDPELEHASVDAVLTLDTWHHIDGREAYAKKVYDGLKQGTRFAVIDYEVDADTGPPQAMRLDPVQVTKQLEAAGFRVEVVPESMPRHYLIIGHKD